MKGTQIGLSGIFLLVGTMTAFAETPDTLFNQPIVPAEKLDEMRGGFSLFENGNELEISIGIERALFINGNLQVSTKFDVPLSGVPGIEEKSHRALNVVQNGSRNYALGFKAGDLPSGIMTLVQNSLDNQTISNLNIINATVTSRDWLRNLAISSSLQDMLAGSIR